MIGEQSVLPVMHDDMRAELLAWADCVIAINRLVKLAAPGDPAVMAADWKASAGLTELSIAVKAAIERRLSGNLEKARCETSALPNGELATSGCLAESTRQRGMRSDAKVPRPRAASAEAPPSPSSESSSDQGATK